MYTPTRAYSTKFSSGTLLALLAFSTIVFLVPLASPVYASNASLPQMTTSSNNPVTPGSQVITVTMTNPTSNQFAITGVSFNLPSGWAGTACTNSVFFSNACVFTATSVSYTCPTQTNCGVPPASSTSFSFTVTVPAAATTYPFNGKVTTSIQDASSPAYYNGPSFNIQVVDTTTGITLTVTPGGSNTASQYTAGTAAYTISAKVTCTVSATCPSGTESGVSVVWSQTGYTAGAVYSFTPASGSSASGGSTSTTFQPSNHATDSASVVATLGTSLITATSGAIATSPGAPTKVTWSLTAKNANGNHYIQTQGTTVNHAPAAAYTGATMAAAGASFSISDRFGNSLDFGAAGFSNFTITITALSGQGKFDASNLPSIITCIKGGGWKSGGTALTPAGTCPAAGLSANLPYNYFQSPIFNAIGEFSGVITGTYASAAFGGAGTSGQLVTSTFAGSSPAPTAIPPTGVVLSAVPAGDSVRVNATLGTAQQGVPVQLFLDPATSTAKYGSNSMLTPGFGGSMQITALTNSNGIASGVFQLSTHAGDSAFFMSNVSAPSDTSVTAYLGPSGDSAAPAVTAAATAASFHVKVTYDNLFVYPASKAATGSTLYVDVTISDAYGNAATNTAKTQIQISLVASCGSGCPLSATNVYIASGGSDTNSSFGPITWTVPSTIGANVSLTASGVLNGVQKTSLPATVTIVSPLPTLAITLPKPVNGVIYSNNLAVVFSGQANASSGFAATGPLAVQISSITYKVDNGAVQTAPISPANKVTFSVAATLSEGLHSIIFNASDSRTPADTATGQTFQVLVDITAPTVKFTTAANSNVSNGAPVLAKIVDTQGDLNMSSVSATINGTAVASSSISITGTNVLGTNTTYTVAINGLTSGTDNIVLSASDLAGNSASTSILTVHITVPFALSVIVNSAQYGTLQGFKGITVSATNVWSSSQTVVVFAVWKNSAGQTVAVSTGGLTLAAGASGTVFAPITSALPTGSYSVTVFVITTANQPVSSQTSQSVSV